MGFVQNELYYIGPYNKFCPTLKQSSSTQPNVAHAFRSFYDRTSIVKSYLRISSINLS